MIMKSTSPMTGRQRLEALLAGKPTDRISVNIRGVRPWDDKWRSRQDESYRPLIQAVAEHCDYVAPIGFESGICYNLTPMASRRQWQEPSKEHPGVMMHYTEIDAPGGPLRRVVAVHQDVGIPMTAEHFVKTADEVERLLAIPWQPPRPDVQPIIDLDAHIGQRGIVMLGLGSDPIGELYFLLGSEIMAFWSVERRDLLHHMLQEFLRRRLDLIDYLQSTGLTRRVPLLMGHVGAEAAVPPLHSPADFRDFCLRYDKPMHEAIHACGSFVHVHCHGSIRLLIDDFIEVGADMLHPVEAPPMGDTPLQEALQRLGPHMIIEGNVQISDLMDEPTQDFRRRMEEVVDTANAAVSSHGARFSLCPTASPYALKLAPQTLENYLALIEIGCNRG